MLAALAVGVVVRPIPEVTWKALAAAEPLIYQEISSSQSTLRDVAFAEPLPGAPCSTDACYWLGPSAPEKVRGGELSGVDVRTSIRKRRYGAQLRPSLLARSTSAEWADDDDNESPTTERTAQQAAEALEAGA
jgi:hypothetical protein